MKCESRESFLTTARRSQGQARLRALLRRCVGPGKGAGGGGGEQ